MFPPLVGPRLARFFREAVKFDGKLLIINPHSERNMTKRRLPALAGQCRISGVPLRRITRPGAMLTRVFSIWLAAAVVVCPHVCNAGSLCDSADHSSPVSCCCHRGTTSDGSQEPGSKVPSDSDSTRMCQCVCAGAVVEKVPQLDALAHLASLIGMPAPDRPVSASLPGQAGQVYPTALPSSMNPGRGLCCLYSNFLC
jgi:hypothetical protein